MSNQKNASFKFEMKEKVIVKNDKIEGRIVGRIQQSCGEKDYCVRYSSRGLPERNWWTETALKKAS